MLGEKGKNGEIYNIAAGVYKPLREFIKEVQIAMRSKTTVHYTSEKALFSLQADISKISNDTGWMPNYDINKYIMSCNLNHR